MKIVDGSSLDNSEILEFVGNRIDILADDGRTMFSLRLNGNRLEIDSGIICKHEGKVLDSTFHIIPRAANLIYVEKPEYK